MCYTDHLLITIIVMEAYRNEECSVVSIRVIRWDAELARGELLHIMHGTLGAEQVHPMTVVQI